MCISKSQTALDISCVACPAYDYANYLSTSEIKHNIHRYDGISVLKDVCMWPAVTRTISVQIRAHAPIRTYVEREPASAIVFASGLARARESGCLLVIRLTQTLHEHYLAAIRLQRHRRM